MRRLVALVSCVGMFAAPAIAASQPASARVTIITMWSAADPQSSSADVRCLDVALRVPFEIGALARALRSHTGARFAIALSPSYASALACAGADPLAAPMHAAGGRSDSRTVDIVTLLAQMPPLTASAAATTGGRELVALTSTAQQWLASASTRISEDDLRRLTALNAIARAANAGSPAAKTLFARPTASTADLFKAADGLLRAQVESALRAGRDAVARGALEFVAAPDGSPVLPLLVDSGGKTMFEPTVMPLNASSDAGVFVADALGAASALDDRRGSGLLAPFGAYDDASAQLIAARGARFAIFSDRVLQTSQAGGSVAALDAAQASPYLAYGLQIGKTATLPLFFWADDVSRALEALPTSLPPGAFASRMMADATAAGATSSDGSARVLTLRLELAGPWANRPDAEAIVDRVASFLARSRATTPSGYLAASRTLTSVYGFAPGSTLGELDAFTASPNQAAMWAALAQAREAAGGDAALKTPAIREALLRVESGRWFLAPTLPLVQSNVKALIDEFRADVRAVYAAAGKPAPAQIAPMRPNTPASPTPSPRPSTAPKLSTRPVNMWRTGV